LFALVYLCIIYFVSFVLCNVFPERQFTSLCLLSPTDQILSALGQGRFSTVHLIKMDGLVMAMKRTDLNSCISDAQAARTEIAVLHRLQRHPHLIRMLGHEQMYGKA
jgi:hypothetical protein